MAFNAGSAVGKLKINAGDWIKPLVKAREHLRNLKASAIKNSAGTRAALQKMGNAAKASFRVMNGAIGKTIGALTSLRGIMLTLGAGVAFRSVIRSATQLESALIGLESVAESVGADMQAAKAAAMDLAKDGLISVADASAGLKNLLSLQGVELDRAVLAMQKLKDAAAFNRQGQLGLGEAVVGATSGIKNQLSVLSDNAGIQKNLSVMQKEYAKSIGTTVGKLTDMQKNIAMVEGTIKEGAMFNGNANKVLGTLGGQLTRAATLFDMFRARLVDTKGPIKDIVQQIGNLLEHLVKAPSLMQLFHNAFSVVMKEVQRILRETFIQLPRMLTNTFATALKLIFIAGFRAIPNLLLPIFQLIASSLVSALWAGLKTSAHNIWVVMNNVFKNLVVAAKVLWTQLFKFMLENLRKVLVKISDLIPGMKDAAREAIASIDEWTGAATESIRNLNAQYVGLTDGTRDFAKVLKNEVEPVMRQLVNDLAPQIGEGLGILFNDIKAIMQDMFNEDQMAQFDAGLERIRAKFAQFRTQIAQDMKTGAGLGLDGGDGDEKEEEQGFWHKLFGMPKGFLEDLGNKAGVFKSLFADVGKTIQKDITTTSQKVAFGMQTFGKAFASAAAAGNSFGDSMKQAMKAALAAVLERISAESAVQAIFQMALGLAALAMGNFASAGNHFAAAALFGSVAGVAGAAAGRVGGGASAAAASSAGSFTGSTSNIGTPPTPVEDVTSTEPAGTPRHVNITLRAEGFVDEEAMSRLVSNIIIPKINEEVNENGRVLVATNISDNGQLSQA